MFDAFILSQAIRKQCDAAYAAQLNHYHYQQFREAKRIARMPRYDGLTNVPAVTRQPSQQ